MSRARSGGAVAPHRSAGHPVRLLLSRVPRSVRVILYATVFLGVAVALLPWGAHRAAHAALPWHIEFEPGRVLGWAVALAALVGYLGSTIWLVRRAGGGYVEFDPPLRLVTGGPYRWSRNPIALCVLSMLLGLSLACSSTGIFVLFLLAIPVAHLQVVVLEEPLLQRRFGAAYERYAATTPRWIPRPRRRGPP